MALRTNALVVALSCSMSGGCTKDNPLWGLESGSGGSTSATTAPSSSSATTTGNPTSPTSSMASSSASGGSTSTTGSGEFGPWVVSKVDELDLDGSTEDDPSATGDELQLFLSVNGPGGDTIHVSTRPSQSDPWGMPVPVPEIDDPAYDEGTAKVSEDGLLLFFHRDSEDGNGPDIWVANRASPTGMWNPPERVDGLNSSARDIGAALVPTLSVVVLCSGRNRTTDLFAADVDLVTGIAQMPQPIAELNTEFEECTPHMTGNALTVVFDSDRPGGVGASDIWMASRVDADAAFGDPWPIAGINTDAGESDPWISPEGTAIYFTRDVGGNQIYVAQRQPL